MLVWIATVEMASTILSILRLTSSSPPTCSRFLLVSSSELTTPDISALTLSMLD